jgi:hypothetical protein
MIKHVFKAEIKGHENDLFSHCNSLDTFLVQAKMLETDVNTKNLTQHAFQALVEFIIKRKNILDNYEPLATTNDDLKVHGLGKNRDGQPASVMAIYVTNPDNPLTANVNHLTTFLANSQAHFNIKLIKNNFYIFSNSIAVHEKTYQQFIEGMGLKDAVCLVMKSDIEKIINDDCNFWHDFKNEMMPIEVPVVEIKRTEKKVLRKHQVKQLKAAQKSNMGILLAPTGTGKSLTEAAIIEDEICNNGGMPVCMICTPRIVLTEQLIRMTFEYLRDRGINAQFLSLNSGKLEDDEYKTEMAKYGLTVTDIPSTTDPKEIEEYYEKSRLKKMPLIIGSTYQSAWKMSNTKIPIDVMICDEAHNLVSCIGRFSTDAKEQVRKIKAKRKYFLTATAAYTDSPEGTGMDNEALFGKIIYTMSPKEAIDAGEIVPPYLHRVYIDVCKIRKNLKLPMSPDNLDDRDIEDNIEVAACIVADAYRQHRAKVKEKSSDPDKIGAKLLIVCKGEPSFKGLLNSDIVKGLQLEFPGLKLYGISSASGGYMNGSQKIENGYKHDFMDALRFLPDQDDAIIFHIDMIGEGIDVSGITGVMSFRELGKIKSTQTLGRAMRLCTIDRANLYNNAIKPGEYNKMVKPYAWIVIPMCSFNQADMLKRMVDMARDMRDTLGYLPFENASEEGCRGNRIEGFIKPNNMFGKTPDELELLHLIDEPEFLMIAEKMIGKAMSNKNSANTIKTLIENGKVVV